MSFIPSTDFTYEVQKGNVPGHRMWGMTGEREGMGMPFNGEDMWRGSANIIPEVDPAGVQMTVVSTSSDDTAAGTGVREVHIDYLDDGGIEQSESITLNGTTGVNTVATNIRHVNHIHSVAVGSDGTAQGNITIHLLGAPATVYNIIEAGGNKDLTCKYMVPLGHKLHLIGWHSEISSNDRVSMRLRSTDFHGELHEGIYQFKGALYLAKAASGIINNYTTVPALSKIKISAYPDQSGGEGSTCCFGILVEDIYS